MEAQGPPTKIACLAESRREGGSPGLGLGLGLGLESGFGHGKCGFTFLQLQELEHQALIFKYIVAGVPVPFHLVLPIWKSVASSFTGFNGGIYLHYRSFLGHSPLCFDYRNSMEPEPGRCRRTDGKRWRCAKDVVPDQKYCERHMHRGRQRSRKHVEASQLRTTATSTTKPKETYSNVLNSNTNLSVSVSVPVSLQLMTNNNSTINNINNNSSNVSPRLGFSPKSVLQGGTYLGCSSLCSNYRNIMETEPGRCRRTDGRKWRCAKDVVVDQKYCERHMHRGSRKRVEASQPTITTTTTASNTHLSTSNPGKSQLMTTNNSNSIDDLPVWVPPQTSVLRGACKTEPSL
ncbi:hypothetical protein HHK36_028779 [Tetracentron sinense]|uniref:Growth-regulating factor n=1 Tax=Tetracentron sinense TaxID=13715 RepID=A0A835D0X6_TETSI|nr:hypothetical protein HHK36_028779 [Tetracentron sinense]